MKEVEFLSRSENRIAILDALRAEPATRRELEESLGIGRVTIGRALTAFEERGWVQSTDGKYQPTFVGEMVAEEFLRLRELMAVAVGLGELSRAIPIDAIGLPTEPLRNATVTTASPGDPYRPLRRFMDLLRDSETLRGFDTTTIAPLYVDEIRAEIMDGMTTNVVYRPPAIEQIVTDYLEEVRSGLDSGHLRLFVNEDIDCGLAIFDERIGIGAYDEDSGMLRVFADTDDPNLREWAIDHYERTRDASIPLSEWLDESS